MLNDPQILNASRSLAKRMTAYSNDLQGRLKYGFLLATGRQPQAPELVVLKQAYQAQLKYYSDKSKERAALLAAEGSPADAAMVMTASTLLNLSESMTRN